MLITCLHTTTENISIFEAARPDGVSLIHHVRPDLLARVMTHSDQTVLEETQLHLRKINQGSDAVLLTCSMLCKTIEPPNYTVDSILFSNAEKLSKGKSVQVLYANEFLTDHIHDLFSPLNDQCELSISLIEGAWDHYLAGETEQYEASIAERINGSQADLIVLGHASMATAGLGNARVISSPSLALQAIKDIAAGT